MARISMVERKKRSKTGQKKPKVRRHVANRIRNQAVAARIEAPEGKLPKGKASPDEAARAAIALDRRRIDDVDRGNGQTPQHSPGQPMSEAPSEAGLQQSRIVVAQVYRDAAEMALSTMQALVMIPAQSVWMWQNVWLGLLRPNR